MTATTKRVVRRTVFFSLAASLLLLTPAELPAVDVVTDPVGFTKVDIVPGPNFVSAPLHRLHAFRGLIASVTSNSITVAGSPGWSANQFGPANGFDQFIVLVRKDASATPGVEGDWWAVLSNTADTLTVDSAPDNLTTLLASGDHVEIRQLVTIKELFGSGASCILNKDANLSANPAQEDTIRYVAGTSFQMPIIYHNGAILPEGYYRGATFLGDGSTITLDPGQAFTLFRMAGSPVTNFTSLGAVQVKRITHYLNPGGNPVGVPFPANARIDQSNLLESGWIQDVNLSANPADEDVLRPVNGTSFGPPVIYHNGSILPAGWYQGATLTNSYSFLPGRGYTIFVKPGTGALRWRQTVPFTP